MKKILPPFLLLLCVFAVSALAQRYTLLMQECDGLFLLTPDYFRWAFEQPFPISQIVSDFLVQFFRRSLYAPWIVAGIVTMVFLLAKGILRVTHLNTVSLPALVAAAAWFVMAVKGAAKPGVAVMLCLIPLWIIALFFRKRDGLLSARADAIVSAVVVVATALLIIFNPEVRRTETWSKVKNAAIYGKWDALSKAIPPEKAVRDHEFTPFALLALDAQHKLGSFMFRYPVYEENDLDMCLEEDYYNSLFFRGIFHSWIGCNNEAIHNFSQLATGVSHGTSYLVLRKLVSENYLAGNYTLAEKYCKILDRSQTHGAFTSAYRKAMKEGSPRPADSLAFRSSVPVITHTPVRNLAFFMKSGFQPVKLLDRLLCTYLLKRDLGRFQEMLQTYHGKLSELPTHYQEAYVLLDPSCIGSLSESVQGRYRSFQEAFLKSTDIKEQKAVFGDTYWFYYYYLKKNK